MTEITNHFKLALQQGQAQIGLWVGLANAYSAEVVAGAGFDWLLLDGEHAPNDVPSLLSQLQAVAPYSSHAVVRPRSNDRHLIKQLLDIGAQTLLVPMIETADEARALVAATRYPPNGNRGVGSALARASRWNRIPGYVKNADDNICVLAQVESPAALRQLPAIAAVDGIDGVFIGPADLSAGMGFPGQTGHPDVVAAIEKAIATVLACGKAPGILTTDETLAKHYLQLGCRFVAVGIDVTLLARACDELAKKYSLD